MSEGYNVWVLGHADRLDGEPFTGYLTLLEAAAVLDIHPDSLRRLVIAGKVPGASKWRGRQWLFEKDALSQFASTYRGRPGRPPSGLFPELERGA